MLKLSFLILGVVMLCSITSCSDTMEEAIYNKSDEPGQWSSTRFESSTWRE